MTPTEFAIFWKEVQLRLPGVAVWIAKQPAEATEADGVTQADIISMWQDELATVSLRDAQWAVLGLYREEIPEPRSWSRFPVVIARHARTLASGRGETGDDAEPEPRFVDGEQVYECFLCLDSGWVEVVHRDTQQAFLDDPESFALKTDKNGRIVMGRSRYTCVVLCTCRAGDRRVKWAHRSEWWKNVSKARIDNSWCLASQTPEQIHAWLVKFRDWYVQTHQSQGELTF